MDEIFDRFTAIADERENRVGIGVGSEASEQLLKEVGHARSHAHIVLVGKERVEGWEFVRAEEPERKLIELLRDGTIDAVVRGTVSARKTLQILKEQTGLRHVHRAALLSTVAGDEFFLTPVGIDEGNSAREQVTLAMQTAKLLDSLHVAPTIGVLSGGRAEDKGRARTVDRTLERAEQLTRRLSALGLEAINYGILIEEAVRSSNVLVAPDGIIGNLIFRTLTLVGGGKGDGAPVLGTMYPFVDTSRSGFAFGSAIIMASALSNLARHTT